MDKPLIVVIACNRPASLKRILESLKAARHPENTDIFISIDGRDHHDTISVAREFDWVHGEKRMHINESRLGLKDHILSCGDLTGEGRPVILLEDDLFVSQDYYSYACAALDFYKNDTAISGIALYHQHFHHLTGLPFHMAETGDDVYFLQYPCSWGVAFTPAQWNGFKTRLSELSSGNMAAVRGVPPNILAWGEKSWKRLFACYMINENRFMVYPRSARCTNFCDRGTHHASDHDYFQVPLYAGDRQPVFTPLNDSAAVYDGWMEILPEKLKRANAMLAPYDFETDIYCVKPAEMLSAPYVLTSEKCRNPVLKFSLKLKPAEMNVMLNLEGEGLYLVNREEVHDGERAFDYLKWFEMHSVPPGFKNLGKILIQQILKKIRSITGF